jgi:hypothetical protein
MRRASCNDRTRARRQPSPPIFACRISPAVNFWTKSPEIRARPQMKSWRNARGPRDARRAGVSILPDTPRSIFCVALQTAPHGWRCRPLLNDASAIRGALTKGGLQISRPAVLSQQVSKCLIGKLLKILHPIPRQQVESIPGLIIELDALARHRSSLTISATNVVSGLGVPRHRGDSTGRSRWATR